MRWVIFCWSDSPLPPEGLREDDVIVCADSGFAYATRCGLTPSLVLGDFDSYGGDLPSGVECIRLPAEKDDTDAMYAARLGLERGVREFLIAGGIGGRLDHTLGAVQTLNFLITAGARASMSDGKQFIEILEGPVSRSYEKNQVKYFSLLSLTPETEGVCLEGFKYPLCDGTLTYDYPLAVSNEMTAPRGTVSLREGRVAVIRTCD